METRPTDQRAQRSQSQLLMPQSRRTQSLQRSDSQVSQRKRSQSNQEVDWLCLCAEPRWRNTVLNAVQNSAETKHWSVSRGRRIPTDLDDSVPNKFKSSGLTVRCSDLQRHLVLAKIRVSPSPSNCVGRANRVHEAGASLNQVEHTAGEGRILQGSFSSPGNGMASTGSRPCR